MKKSKLFFIILILCLILLCILIYFLTRPAPEGNNSEGKETITNTIADDVEKGELRELTLNFKSTQVVISLYPYANKNPNEYKYRLFDIVYIGSVNTNAQFPGKYITPGEDWTGSYIASMETDTIFMAMSQQIWHRMELKSKDDLNITNCNKNDVELADGFIAESYNCSESMSFCYLPIDSNQGIVYSAYPSSLEPLDFCTIAKQNSIKEISLRSY